MLGEDLVDQIIEAKIAKLVEKVERVHGFAAFEETKAATVAELKKAGEELKEALKVSTIDQMKILDIIARGGTVYVEIFDPTKHGYGSSSTFTAKDIATQVANGMPYNSNATQLNKAKVIVIIDPR